MRLELGQAPGRTFIPLMESRAGSDNPHPSSLSAFHCLYPPYPKFSQTPPRATALPRLILYTISHKKKFYYILLQQIVFLCHFFNGIRVTLRIFFSRECFPRSNKLSLSSFYTPTLLNLNVFVFPWNMSWEMSSKCLWARCESWRLTTPKMDTCVTCNFSINFLQFLLADFVFLHLVRSTQWIVKI